MKPRVRPNSFLRIRPGRGRWIHRFGRCAAEELRHPRHARWMATNSHRHGHREIMAVIEGDHFYGVRGHIFRARPGSVFLFDHDESHDAWYSPYQPNCQDIWLCFSSPQQIIVTHVCCRHGRVLDAVHGAGTKKVGHQFRRSQVVTGPFVETVTESWDHCTKVGGTSSALLQLKAAVTALLLHIERCSHQPPMNRDDSVAQRQVVEHIQKHIQEHPGDELTMKTLARLAGYDPAHFHRLFRRHTGLRLHQHVSRVRLARAKELLASGRSVQSVAADSGFATAAYFSRFFKNATGQSPVRWKNFQAG